MQDVILSPISVTDLVNAISADVLAKISHLVPQQNALPDKDPEKLLTRSQVATLLGVSLVTLHKYTVSGMVPAYRINGGRKVRYKEMDVRHALTKIQSV